MSLHILAYSVEVFASLPGVYTNRIPGVLTSKQLFVQFFNVKVNFKSLHGPLTFKYPIILSWSCIRSLPDYNGFRNTIGPTYRPADEYHYVIYELRGGSSAPPLSPTP